MQNDDVKKAVEFMLLRDEDGNLLNPYLNEFESKLYLKLSSYDSVSGESTMLAFQEKLEKELLEAVTKCIK